jgi:glycosyltransferase involved in cell wall biosynthesis
MPLEPSTLNVVVDQRFEQSPDGRIWTYMPPGYRFFLPMLEVFSRVRVIARVQSVAAVPNQAQELTGPGVELFPVPNYVGPWQYARKRTAVWKAVAAATQLEGAFLLRIPSHIGFLAAHFLRSAGRPFATELLTDPKEFFAFGVARFGLTLLFRNYFVQRSRQLCAAAIAANYITGSRTRREFPSHPLAWSASVSDVELPPEAFLPLRPPPLSSGSPLRIVTAGKLDLFYKGQDLLIRALAACAQQGLSAELTFVGDGNIRGQLETLAASLGVAARVHFAGSVAGAAEVRRYFAQADLFSLPSRAEGIPRALLEAMAAGLPAICTGAGAMADLIDQEWIVPQNSASALASRIRAFALSPSRWAEIGERNQLVARTFAQELLRPQRVDFYRAIRQRSAQPLPLGSCGQELAHA